MTRPLVLVLDGDTAVRALLESVIEKVGGEYRGAADADGALRILKTEPIRAALVDTSLSPDTFETLMHGFRSLRPTAVVAGLGTGLADPGADRLLEAGIFDLVPKPMEPGSLSLVAKRALEQSRLLESYARLRDGVRGRSGYQRLVGRSSFMENLRGTLERLAPGDGSVLFYGPVGTGRELAARYLHSISARREASFQILDCSTFPAAAMEAELFGEDGREGLLTAGRNGSVFLEEIGRLPLETQGVLAEALASGRIGCRILASNVTELSPAVQDGVFREDLLHHLRSAVYLEPLSRRMEDLPVLARHFLDSICQINDLPSIELSSEALDVLGTHHWPDNIRELRNAMEQAAILASGTVQPEDLPARIREQQRSGSSRPEPATLDSFRAAKKKIVDAFEEKYLSDLLMRNRGNVTAAAETAGMLRSALQRLLRKHGIRSSEFRIVSGSGRSAGIDRELSPD